ncbi:MAG: PorV/PorQ family protein [Bacteroidota bacterium]
MTKFVYIFGFLAFFLVMLNPAEAGNPDRQGQAGAAQLLLNPWARSAGLHTMNTAGITGVEAMRLNVAGLARLNKTELLVSHARYLVGTEINMNAVGFGQRLGKSGTFGVTLMAMDLGDIPVTTENQPEGTGAFFSPSLFNLGISYAHMFENKVAVGITFRGVSESNTDVGAFGFAIDAGVQYVTGPKDNFKFGISLRNVGSPMKFSGEGLSEQAPNPNDGSYNITYFTRSDNIELPSMLNIGASYDFLLQGDKHRITVMGNFTSNSFSQDQLGGGVEYAFNNMFMIRGGYKYEFRTANRAEDPIYNGVSAGVSLNVPLRREGTNRFGIDYAYRQTKILNGTHNIGIRITL